MQDYTSLCVLVTSFKSGCSFSLCELSSRAFEPFLAFYESLGYLNRYFTSGGKKNPKPNQQYTLVQGTALMKINYQLLSLLTLDRNTAVSASKIKSRTSKKSSQ